MAPANCKDAQKSKRILEKAIDLFWVLSFIVGAVVGAVDLLLTASVAGVLAAVGITVVAGVGMAVIYKKLSDGLRKVNDWIAQHC
jgi:hypothetical protein